MQKYKEVPGFTPNRSRRCQIKFSVSRQGFFLSLKQKDTPIVLSQSPKSTEQNSRSLRGGTPSPKTMTLYSLNSGKTCCRTRVCSSKLLFPNLGNSDQYNGMALRSLMETDHE